MRMGPLLPFLASGSHPAACQNQEKIKIKMKITIRKRIKSKIKSKSRIDQTGLVSGGLGLS